MMTTRLFALGLAIFPAARAERPAARLNPTRLDWCAGLLEVRDQAPADDARVRQALAAARRRLDAIVDGLDGGSRAHEVAPHVRRVVANVRRGPLGPDHDRALREARGRLLGLTEDFETSPGEFAPLARVDVGRDAVLGTLGAIAAAAAERTSRNGVPNLDPDYYVRSFGDVAALTALTGAFGYGTEYFWTDPNRNAFGLFLGATAMSLWGFWDLFRYHRRNLATPAGRIALENRYNRDRVDVEAHGAHRLARLAEYPTDEFYAHDGYSLYLPEASVRDLYARALRPAPYRTSYARLRRAPFALLVDLVLFEGEDGRPALISALRTRATRDVPKTWGGLRLLGDI